MVAHQILHLHMSGTTTRFYVCNISLVSYVFLLFVCIGIWLSEFAIALIFIHEYWRVELSVSSRYMFLQGEASPWIRRSMLSRKDIGP